MSKKLMKRCRSVVEGGVKCKILKFDASGFCDASDWWGSRLQHARGRFQHEEEREKEREREVDVLQATIEASA
jgi:hypothetical protein